AGRFKVEGLGLGKYSLVEKRAPAGYRLDTTQHPFQLAADHLDHAFAEPFVNKRASVPRLPLTGGRGAYIFLIAGAVVSAVAISTGLLRRRRHRNLD
ncbi:MAG: prealbumin-like fold domain-containing protein, partial [Actinomyces sp.]